MPKSFPTRARLRAASLAFCLAASAASHGAETTPSAAPAASSQPPPAPEAALAGFIDRLPDLLDIGLPGFAPSGAVRLYSHPHFGDLLHEDYFRLPVGARFKVSDQLELNAELSGYFTHGFGDSVGNGLYEFHTGVKYERSLAFNVGTSVGIDYITPLSRPPYEITDGLRHTMPFVTITDIVLPRWDLVGFATLGADLIDYTPLRLNFRKNELRANSLILTLGVAREWRRMHVILRVFDGNTALLSHRSQNAFGFRPSLGVPLLRRPDGSPRATATFEGRTIWGPDGFETGVNTSVRIDFRYRPGHNSR